MLLNYIKIAFRNLLKHKTFSTINLLGLSFSMSVCLLMITMINDQFSYDSFHENKDRIYRIITDIEEKNGNIKTHASTAMPIGKLLENDYSGIEKAASFCSRSFGEIKYDEKRIPVSGYFANQNFLEVFSFKLRSGDQHMALEKPYSVVLTEEMASNVFEQKDPIGQTIEIGNKGLYTVTGILDKPAYKSHMKFEVLCSSRTMKILEDNGQLFLYPKIGKLPICPMYI